MLCFVDSSHSCVTVVFRNEAAAILTADFIIRRMCEKQSFPSVLNADSLDLLHCIARRYSAACLSRFHFCGKGQKGMTVQKIRKYAILLMLPLHLIFYWAMLYGPRADYIYDIAMIVILLIDFALSAWQTELFSARRSRVRDFLHAFTPHLLQKTVLLAAGWCIVLINGRGNIRYAELEILFGVIFISVIVVLSGLVTFVTGAAKTMLYHDESK